MQKGNAEPAPAKINLCLHVTGRREDGYHLLDSIVIFASVSDQVRLLKEGEEGLTITGPFAAHTPTGKDNLTLHAVRWLRARMPGVPAVALMLEKNIPVGAGLGGGSADAAAVLRLLCRKYGIILTEDDLADAAAELGADVPVCFYSKPCRMHGVGERIVPIASIPPMYFALAYPASPLATSDVFGQRRGKFALPLPTLPFAPDKTVWQRWLQSAENSLEPSSGELLPLVNEVKLALQKQPECLLARMSGSGSACFGWYETEAAARRAAADLKKQHPYWWVMPAYSYC